MDISLFTKHLVRLNKQEEEKKNIISYIFSETQILLDSKEIQLHNKKVSFIVSSVIYTKLNNKNIKQVLTLKGYNC